MTIRYLLLFAACLMRQTAFSQANFTFESHFVIQVNIEGQQYVLERGNGFLPPTPNNNANYWGAPILNDLCGELAWAEGQSGNHTGCDTFTNDLSGKIALIRRGDCDFGLKYSHAVQSGAIACLIVNHDASPLKDCQTFNMAPGYNVGNVIPLMSLSRTAGYPLAQALDAGKQVEICFHLVSMFEPFAEYVHAVPVDQARPMDQISVKAANNGSSPQTLQFKAEIMDPNGTWTTLTQTATIAAGDTNTIQFGTYTPPNVAGRYLIRYSNDQATDLGDTLVRYFRLTPHTWSTDNFECIGTGVSVGNNHAQTGYRTLSQVRTGPTGATAHCATFGLSNPEVFANADSLARNIFVLLVDADADNNGSNDLQDDFSDISSALVGYGMLNVPVGLAPDSLLNLPLAAPDGTPSILLKPNHLYYSVLSYTDTVHALPIFTSSEFVQYGLFVQAGGQVQGPSTQHQLETLETHFGATEVNRLHTVPCPSVTIPNSQQQVYLAPHQYRVSPNPARDYLYLELELTTSGKPVHWALVDMLGQTVRSQTTPYLAGAPIRIATTDLARGAYVLLVVTAEGAGAVQVILR